MARKKGFTLIEMIVVLVIVGIAAAFAIPHFLISIEQTKAQTAKNNLLAISAAEQRYSEDNNGSYCINTGTNATCGNNTANLNTNLHLSMSSNEPFTYSCSNSVSPYLCTTSDQTIKLTTSGSSVSCCTLTSSTCRSGGSACPN